MMMKKHLTRTCVVEKFNNNKNNNNNNNNFFQDMRNSFNLLLIVLAWFDIFFIIIAVLDYSVARGVDDYDGNDVWCSFQQLNQIS